MEAHPVTVSPGLLVVLAMLSTFRLTWLVNNDTIARPLRAWAYRHDVKRHGPVDDDEVPPLSYFVTCPWCVSMYVAPPVAVATVLWGDNRVILIALVALASSAVTGAAASVLKGWLGG